MVVIYEDEGYKNFLPLVYLRPVFDLLVGRMTLFERITNLYPEITTRSGVLVRDYLAPWIKEKYRCPVNEIPKTEGPILFISSRVLLNEKIPLEGDEEIFLIGKEIIGARIRNKSSKLKIQKSKFLVKTFQSFGFKKRTVEGEVFNFLFDLIRKNSEILKKDFSLGTIKGDLSARAVIEGELGKLYLAPDSKIEPFTILNLNSGPIIIDEGAKIGVFSYLQGPCYIGKNTIIERAKIGQGTSIGENCRISGEVENSIFLGFSNKHHEGFIGNSYIGEWVNLGAGTTNSDLKNNYSTVKVQLGKKEYDSGLLKLGCFIGDHAKTAIGTMINTGATIGIFANVLFEGRTPKNIPSFYWKKGEQWQIGKAVETARTMMARRNIAMTKNYEELIRYLYARIARP